MATLLVGYTAQDLFERGKHGRRFTAKWALEGEITCHTLDIYQRHAIEKAHHLKAVCSAHLPAGNWDEIRFKTGPKRMSGELALDMLQEIAALLGGDLSAPRFRLEYEGKERDRNSLIAKIRDQPGRTRDFSARWQASVPGLEPVEFTSFPGCFCHRRRDEGGLALAEVVCREFAQLSADGFDLLDMGCGSGMVGLLIARALKGVKLTGVDSHSRAIEAATLNAARLGVPAELILADSGTPSRLDGTFDVFVGNPPYYSDYRIADVFLETASRALKVGGRCYTVCKNAAGLESVHRRYFDTVETIARRGYSVLKSMKV